MYCKRIGKLGFLFISGYRPFLYMLNALYYKFTKGEMRVQLIKSNL